MSKAQHPIQPVEKDDKGVYRFKKNSIVVYLLESGPFDMNHLAQQGFSREDREQFAQLVGYSVCGFGDLSYATERVCGEAYEEMESDGSELPMAVKFVMEDCYDCPHFGRRPIGGKWPCDHGDNELEVNMIEDPSVVPEWCPLPRDR